LTAIIPSVICGFELIWYLAWQSHDCWIIWKIYGEWIVQLDDHDKLKFELSVKDNFITELLRKDFSFFYDKISEFYNIFKNWGLLKKVLLNPC
jgi:hypothetical protein